MKGTIIVTCTTPERKAVMQRCRFYRERWGHNGAQWLIVDGARSYQDNLCSALLRLPENWERLVFMEDDDWYSPLWLMNCERELREFQMVGCYPTRYYQPKTRTYAVGDDGLEHSSLCATGIRRDAFPVLVDALDLGGATYLDIHLWERAKEKNLRRVFLDSGVVGMKGLTKNPAGEGHDTPLRMRDPGGDVLVDWIGKEDAGYYFNQCLSFQ